MRHQDSSRSLTTIVQRQWQTVNHIGPYSHNERVPLIAVKETNPDFIVTTEQRRPQSMHTINNTHSRAVRDDRRQHIARIGKGLNMNIHLAARPRRIST